MRSLSSAGFVVWSGVFLAAWSDDACAAQQQGTQIVGRVLTEDGEPLTGATVRIATARVRRGVSPY